MSNEKCSACCRKTDRSDELVKKLVNRLSRIEGQIRGIRGMIENDAYCNDILVQSAAVSAAMNSLDCAMRYCSSNHGFESCSAS